MKSSKWRNKRYTYLYTIPVQHTSVICWTKDALMNLNRGGGKLNFKLSLNFIKSMRIGGRILYLSVFVW